MIIKLMRWIASFSIYPLHLRPNIFLFFFTDLTRCRMWWPSIHWRNPARWKIPPPPEAERSTNSMPPSAHQPPPKRFTRTSARWSSRPFWRVTMAPCSLTGRPAVENPSRCEASSSEPWNICSRRLRPRAPRRGIASCLRLLLHWKKNICNSTHVRKNCCYNLRSKRPLF